MVIVYIGGGVSIWKMISMGGGVLGTSVEPTSYEHLRVVSDGYLRLNTIYEELGSRTIASLRINHEVALSSLGMMLNYLTD